MSHINEKKPRSATYFSIDQGSGNKLFKEIRLPGGTTVRLMNKTVYERALKRADDRLRQVNKESCKKYT